MHRERAVLTERGVPMSKSTDYLEINTFDKILYMYYLNKVTSMNQEDFPPKQFSLLIMADNVNELTS